MKVLFITSTRIGDAVLSTGLLDHIITTYPQSRITLVCGPLAASLFDGLPHLDELIVLKKQKRNKHWMALWQKVIGTRWDMVVDLRNSAVSRLIFAKKRYIHGSRIDKTRHKVEQNAQCMGLEKVPNPKLYFSEEQKNKAKELILPGQNVLGICPTSNWIGKTWPVENFIELTKRLTEEGGAFDGWRVAVFAAPGEEVDAEKLLYSISQEKRIDLIAKGSPGLAAACIARCQYYIGNDSGLMHCAAASFVPTLGLFGPTRSDQYSPWKASFIRTPESYEELTGFEGYDAKTLDRSLMGSLEVEAVLNAIKTGPTVKMGP